MAETAARPEAEINVAEKPNPHISRPKSGYIPTLDGWRTVAIAAVIFYHSRPIEFGRFTLEHLQNFGDRGVQLFFAISGILICSRLLEEQRRCGEISLKGFYVRRVFRIQPAAIVYLSAFTLLGLFGVLHISRGPTFAALFSYRNFWDALNLAARPDDRYTVHFWSLGVEEQFYLILPLLLVLARKRVLPVLLALSTVAFIWPVIAHHLGIAGAELAYQRLDLAIRDLFVPALLAVAMTRPEFRERLVKLTRHNILIWAVLAALLISQLLLDGHPTSMITCLGFPLVVISTVLHPTGRLGRVLESRLFLFGGRISYSLYLWQELFFIHRDETSWLRFLQITPVNILCAIVFAVLSYYVIEKPFIRLGHRLAPPATPGRKDLSRGAEQIVR